MLQRRPPRTLTTGERTLHALQFIVERGPECSVKELAAALDVSLATAYHLVHTLVAAGFVILERHRSLRPGPALYRLLDRLAAHGPRPESLEPLVDEVGRLTECRAYLATWSDRDVEVLYVHGRRGVRELPGLARGFRGAAHALALGKVLLAQRPPSEWPDYLREEPLPRFTAYTLTARQALQSEIDRVREQDVGFDREEYALGSCCIAVPLESGHRSTPLALGISVPRKRFAVEADLLTGLLRQVQQAV